MELQADCYAGVWAARANANNQILEQGATAEYQSPAQLGDKVKTDYTEWAKVIKASQIEAD